ncbi:hypothetical protein PpBr36_00951 [Pyricularia pennisetigena]|uniref:hypothetical protein n=1 Tax=Pyricularia pennisetigena TaxID=1578925 RepID=UPI0011532A12|nr:hypothetical protein PpBr36_00951 [Pyricularia pennisetigena]TLS28243.1 hypothetical protein PpBr36_00951 [Pyricularia pennisetigena]
MRVSSLALLGVAAPAMAAQTGGCSAPSQLDAIIARGHLKVGMTGAYKPFSYLDTDSTTNSSSSGYIGADVDMAKSLSQAMGLTKDPEFVHATFANMTTEINEGKYDIGMTGVSITLARARSCFYSNPLIRVGKVATVRCEDAFKYQSLAAIDVEGVRVATPSGGSNEVFDRANLKKAEILVYTETDNNIIFQAVVDKKADVMITDRVEAELQAKMHPGVLCAVNPEEPFSFEEIGYIMKRDVVLQQFVNQWLHVQQGSGAWSRTLQSWMDYPWPHT